MSEANIQVVTEYFKRLQDQITHALESEDETGKFKEDTWEYAQGGGGRSRLLENGAVIERGGINFSHVRGMQLPPSATIQRGEMAGCLYEATGISMVIHPENPYAPTMHANLRFFLIEKEKDKWVWWFGGGFDMTPYYGFAEDCKHWHSMAKQACEPFGADIYPNYKRWCDEYFYLKHRDEPRGIGGLFFDDLNVGGFDRCFEFVRSVGDHILPAYLPIIKRRKKMLYGKRERDFQMYRRGRYVESNLVYDRGTLFGLQSGGRVESILMSLPPIVTWKYDWHPEPGSKEEELYQKFLVAGDWI